MVNMKRFLNSGLTYLVVLFMILSSVSVNVWAQETSDTADSSQSRIEEKQKTSSKESLDTADELLSNDSKETKKDSSDQESASDSKKTEYTFEDAKIKVKALLKKADAISDQAELKVKEIPENTTEYKKYENALNKKSNSYSNVLLYDISFVLDGKEVEPTDGSVKVSMEFKDQQLSDDLKVKATSDLKVIHFKDNDINKQETLKPTTNVKNETTSFETKSFSTYAVVTGNGEPKNVYSVSDFSVPDYGYGVTAQYYYQSGDTETNVFVDHYDADAKELGASGNYSNAGGYDYIGSIDQMNGNGLDFYQQPMKLYLGTAAYNTYLKDKSKFKVKGTQIKDSYVEKNETMSASAQLTKMGDAYSNVLNKISFKDADTINSNSFTIDLRNLPKGTYAVKFSGSTIDPNSKIYINEGQHLIFYCTASGTFTCDRYNIAALSSGKEESTRTMTESTNYVGTKDPEDDWKTEAVSFYMPNVTSLDFPAGTCGVFVAPNASMTKGSTCGGVIGVYSFGTSSSRANGEWHYHNHELPNPEVVQFAGKKEFTNDWPTGRTYSLELTKGDNNDAPMPSDNTTISLSQSNPSSSFGKIKINSDLSKSGDVVYYYYQIHEIHDGQTDIEYDDKVYTIRVTVNYGQFGAVKINDISYKTSDNSNYVKYQSALPFTFTNTHKTNKSTTANISINKTVDNKKPADGQKFNFNLVEGSKSDFSNPTAIESNVENDSDGSVQFKQITYNEVGTHYYKVDETTTSNQYKSSGPIYVKVVVSENSNILSSKVTYYSDIDFSNPITNTDTPVINNQTIGLSITKVDADKSETPLSGATFTLYKGTLNGITLTQGDSIGDGVETGSDGKATFNNLAYGSAYLLEETKAPEGYETNGPWAVQIDDNGKTTLTKISNSNDNVYTLSSNKDNIQTRDFGYTNPFEIGDKKTEYTLPSTGGSGTKAYYTIGMLVSMLCIVYVVLKKKKGGLFKEKKNL